MKDEHDNQRRRWTEEEDDFIRKYYYEYGTEIACQLDRSKHAVATRASVLGISHKGMGGKREKFVDPNLYGATKEESLDFNLSDISLEEFQELNRRNIKQLSFRNVEEGTYNSKKNKVLY